MQVTMKSYLGCEIIYGKMRQSSFKRRCYEVRPRTCIAAKSTGHCSGGGERAMSKIRSIHVLTKTIYSEYLRRYCTLHLNIYVIHTNNELTTYFECKQQPRITRASTCRRKRTSENRSVGCSRGDSFHDLFRSQ